MEYYQAIRIFESRALTIRDALTPLEYFMMIDEWSYLCVI